MPDSQFLPNDPDYLDQGVTAGAVSVIAGSSSGSAAPAVPAPTATPATTPSTASGSARVTLAALRRPRSPGGAETAAAEGDDAIEVEVQNQGDGRRERHQRRRLERDGSIESSRGDLQIAAGETQTVTIPLQPAPQAGETVDLEVTVATVGGEQVAENNEGVFPVTF